MYQNYISVIPLLVNPDKKKTKPESTKTNVKTPLYNSVVTGHYSTLFTGIIL